MVGLKTLAAMAGAALVWALIPGQSSAASPSFDCDKSKTDVERIICNDDELAALDVELAKAFANALAHAPAYTVNDLRDVQKSWRRTMLNCSKTDDARACTVAAYRERLQQL